MKDNITSVLDPFDQNLYDIETERVKADAFYQNVTIPYISVKPKAHVFDSAGFADIPKTIFRFTIKNAELSTDGLISAVRRKEKLKFSNILFPDIAVTVYQNPVGQDMGDNQDTTLIQGVVIQNLDLHIKEFLHVPLYDTTFTLLTFSNTSAKGEFSATFPEGDSLPKLDFKDQIVSANDLLFQNFDDIYNLSVDSFYYDNQRSQLDLKGINVKPRFDNDEVISKIQWQTDIIRTRISSLSFYPFSLADVINQKQLFLDHIDIKGGIIDVFRDRTLPFDTLKRPPMPVERIMNAPLTLKLDTISIENIDVVYTELPENAEEAGEVPFRNLKADLFNMTNQRQAIQSDSLMRIEAEAFVFGSALLKAGFVYDLTSDRGVYNANGSLSDFDMDIINPAVFPLTGLKILSGDHRETSFSYQGDNDHTTGQVKMVYQNLEINLLPGKSDFISNTANWAGKKLVYYAENPQNGEELRIGEIDFERDKTRFVFHYWWKSYYSGIKDTAMRGNIIMGN
ncbi:MAG: hypothetical protein ACLFQS_03660 [Bacteroidales bacterium]